MGRTPVYIICSPRPQVGKTLLARLLAEYLKLEHGRVAAYDLNHSDPSLIDYLPHLTETADIGDTRGQIALMDQLIADDGVPKIVDLGYPSFDAFFRMTDEIGFMKESLRRGVEPVVLFLADRDRASARAFLSLRQALRQIALVPILNNHVLHGEVPETYTRARPLAVRQLPAFLKSIIDRTTFSFRQYLHGPNDPSAELHQWIRTNFEQFHALELNLILHKL